MKDYSSKFFFVVDLKAAHSTTLVPEVIWARNNFSLILTFQQKTPPKAAALGGVSFYKYLGLISRCAFDGAETPGICLSVGHKLHRVLGISR